MTLDMIFMIFLLCIIIFKISYYYKNNNFVKLNFIINNSAATINKYINLMENGDTVKSFAYKIKNINDIKKIFNKKEFKNKNIFTSFNGDFTDTTLLFDVLNNRKSHYGEGGVEFNDVETVLFYLKKIKSNSKIIIFTQPKYNNNKKSIKYNNLFLYLKVSENDRNIMIDFLTN